MTEKWQMEGKPVLVILHLQEGMVGSGEEFHFPGRRTAAGAYRASGVLPNVINLLEAFRNASLPRVFVSAMPNPLGRLPA
jgi:hypothetical protein